MKKLCLILLLSSTASAWAGNPPVPSEIAKPAPAVQIVQAQAAPQQNQELTTQAELNVREMPLYVETPAPNETTRGRIKMDGILVQAVKADNPLQLINPAAPERYGSADDNVARDFTSGKVSGLKFLELRF